MPVYQGTQFSRVFRLKSKTTNTAMDLTGWMLKAQIRVKVDDAEPKLELTTENGGFNILSPASDGRVQMVINGDQSNALSVGKYIFDVLREDTASGDPGPIWLFAGSFKVKEPVTR